MKKLTSKKSVILYGCSGLGVNMLNLIVGSYLCSALLVGGFDAHVENWTYLNKDLVVAGLWSVLILVAKVVDGLIDLPLSHFVDNLKTKWGKRKTGIVMGFIPMIIAYLLFLIPIDPTASLANTIWFGTLLLVFYTAYTLTMITYYATFAEVTEKSFYEGTAADDYLQIILTDEEDVPEALGRLRQIYPNIMKLTYDNTRTRSSCIIDSAENVQRKSPLELFEELYEIQNNQPMSDVQRNFALELIVSIQEGRL